MEMAAIGRGEISDRQLLQLVQRYRHIRECPSTIGGQGRVDHDAAHYPALSAATREAVARLDQTFAPSPISKLGFRKKPRFAGIRFAGRADTLRSKGETVRFANMQWLDISSPVETDILNSFVIVPVSMVTSMGLSGH